MILSCASACLGEFSSKQHSLEQLRCSWQVARSYLVPVLTITHVLTVLFLHTAAVAGVSFAWTVVISCMRGALDSMQQSAPTTAQLEEAVAQVAAAAAQHSTALAEPLPTVTAASPAETSGRTAAAAGPSSAAAAGAAVHGSVLASSAGAGVSVGPAQAARVGFKALVPRPHVPAEAAG